MPVPEAIRPDQLRILEACVLILQGVIKFAVIYSCRLVLPPHIRFLGKNCVDALIDYRRRLIQLLPISSHPILQLPLAGEDYERLAKRKKIPNLVDLLKTQ